MHLIFIFRGQTTCCLDGDHNLFLDASFITPMDHSHTTPTIITVEIIKSLANRYLRVFVPKYARSRPVSIQGEN